MSLTFLVGLFTVILFISMVIEFDSDFKELIVKIVMYLLLITLYLVSINIAKKEGCINASIGKPDYQLIINDDSTRTWEKIWEINNETDR